MMHKLHLANLTELVLVAMNMGLLTTLAAKCAEPNVEDVQASPAGDGMHAPDAVAPLDGYPAGGAKR